MYKFFERNIVGHDFVCGDIHGCVQDLYDELDAIKFNKTTDRLFVVGDLIDRGPNSLQALQLLNEPWFFSVMGNHEALMILSDLEQRTGSKRMTNSSVWFNNGGLWWTEIDSTTQYKCIQLAKQLPIIIEIQVGEKRIGLIHAEIMDITWQQAVDSVKDVTYNDFVWDKTYPVSDFLWSRKKIRKYIYSDCSYPIDGIDHIFHGHTILGDQHTLSNCTYIDTGCYNRHTNYGGFLTIVDLNQFVQQLEDNK